MRILITTNNIYKKSGINTTLFIWLKLLEKYNVNIDLLVENKKFNEGIDLPTNVNVIYLDDLVKMPKDSKIKKFFYEFFYKRKLLKFAECVSEKLFTYDYAIAYNGFNLITDIIAANVNANKKYIWVHSSYKSVGKHNKIFKLRLNRKKNIYINFDKIICVSKSSKDEFIDIFPKLRDKVDYINTLFNFNYKEETDDNMKYDFTNGLNYITIGKNSKNKGVFSLVKAFVRYNKYNKIAKLYIVGDGPLDKKITKYISKNQLKKNIILTGVMKNPMPLLKKCDVYISNSKYEGWPTVLLEAISVNKFLIVSDVSGNRDVIKEFDIDNKFSILFKRNKKHLIKCLIKYDKLTQKKVKNNDFLYNNYTQKNKDKFLNLVGLKE